jgi:transcriptional regulator with XRE-family HTH domain
MGKRQAPALPPEVREPLDQLADALAALADGEGAKATTDALQAVDAAITAARAAGWRRRDEPPPPPEAVSYGALVGANIRLHRNEGLGWTQAQLADAMARAGFGWKRITVAEVERGDRRFTLEELVGLAEVFNEPVGELLLPDPYGLRCLELPGGRLLGYAELRDLIFGSWAGPFRPEPAGTSGAKRRSRRS